MKAQNQDYPLLLAPEQSNEPRHPLGRPLSGNRMERIVITPVVATALLESFSRKNRNISENHVNKVAGSIRLGHWVHSSSVIHLSGDGTLQDGYHRMYACIKAGVPFETWVEFDCHEKTFETVDHVSRPRSYADNLRAAGESSALCLAASVNLLANWLNGCRNTSLATTSLDSDSLAAVLAVHPHLRDSVAATQLRDFCALAARRWCSPSRTTCSGSVPMNSATSSSAVFGRGKTWRLAARSWRCGRSSTLNVTAQTAVVECPCVARTRSRSSTRSTSSFGPGTTIARTPRFPS